MYPVFWIVRAQYYLPHLYIPSPRIISDYPSYHTYTKDVTPPNQNLGGNVWRWVTQYSVITIKYIVNSKHQPSWIYFKGYIQSVLCFQTNTTWYQNMVAKVWTSTRRVS